ncbi:MAG: tripartite tricarboxylate transporter substrate-binding protein [Deinococcota bacterium]|jgi:putative tricarboxylic transport membrane protein|nr:tripartite tricarboxylate transporter substrate-binding protein [Deinococcota bacterium]
MANINIKRWLLLLLVLSLGAASAQGISPRNVLCIAPSDPGGGWDFTCRSIAPLLTNLGLVQGQIRTQNMAGAGGGVAYAHVVGQQEGNENLIVAASTATTTRIAQGQFTGFDEDDVRWVAAVGSDYGVIAVAPDSPYESLTDLMDALEEDPGSVTFVGGSAIGGWDHLKVLLAARQAGIENVAAVRYVSFSSGGAAIVEILGGRAQAFSGDVSEAIPQIEAGNLKVLAVLSEERLGGLLENVPTAQEQGLDVIGANWRGFYVPAGVSDEVYDYWVEAFRQLEESQEYEALREQSGLADFWRGGEEMTQFVYNQVETIRELSAQIEGN